LQCIYRLTCTVRRCIVIRSWFWYRGGTKTFCDLCE